MKTLRPRHGTALLLLALAGGFGCSENPAGAPAPTTPKEHVGPRKELVPLLGEPRDKGALASTAMTLLNAMANHKIKGVDVPLAKRVLYQLTYKVVALREDAPELTKSDLLIYNESMTAAMKQLMDLLKDADPEQQSFQVVEYSRVTQGHAFVVCGDGEVFACAIRPSPRGLPGADLYIVTPKSSLCIHDFRLCVQGQDASADGTRLTVKDATCEMKANSLQIVHKMKLDAEFDLIAMIRPDLSAIRIAVESPEPVTDMSLGPIAAKATRLALDSGVLDNPASLVIPAGDARLKSGAVGMEFENGMSLAIGCDGAPERLEVDAAKGLYALHAGRSTSLWLAPGSKGISQAVARCRSGVQAKR